MAAYPSHNILLGSKMELEGGVASEFDASGGIHQRQFYSQRYYTFTLKHQLTVAQWRTLLDTTYGADPTATWTLTYFVESPAVTYSVKFLGPPTVTNNHGNGKVDVEVSLRGFKD